MKQTLTALLLITLTTFAHAAKPPAQPAANVRTISNLPNFPRQALRQGVNPRLYRSLTISPITAWVVARAPVSGAGTSGARIIQSDANGAFDKMALELANGFTVTGMNTTESRMALDNLTVHLLIYKTADGAMAICFANMDDSRYADYRQHGVAMVAVMKGGKWTVISHDNSKPTDQHHRGFY